MPLAFGLAIVAGSVGGCIRSESPQKGSAPAAVSSEAAAPERPSAPAAAAKPPAPAEPDPRSGEPVAREPLPDGYLTFAAGCNEAPSITVAAIGDLLMHRELQCQAYGHEDGFSSLWSQVQGSLDRADLTYGNLEGPTAKGLLRSGEEGRDPGLHYDHRVYTGYPKFNYNPILATDLVRSGFDVVSTANNHSLDRGPSGVDRTIDSLLAAGLKFTGTKHRSKKVQWYAVTNTPHMNVAWIACTHHTNMIEDPFGQVLFCHADERVERLIKKLRGTRDIHAVIVTPHWGKEYQPLPRKQQVEAARRWVEAGATAIIGSHPHVLQPWEKQRNKAGEEVFVLYSLGNFASHQRELPRRSSIILYLELKRVAEDRAVVSGVRYLPIHMEQKGKPEQFSVLPIGREGQPADVLDHIIGVYGPHNRIDPSEPLDLTPHCDPKWTPR